MLTGVWKEETGIWFGSRNKYHVILSAYQTEEGMLPFFASPAAGKEPLSSDFIAYGKGAFEEAKRPATGMYAGAMKQIWSPELPRTSEPVILALCSAE